MKCEYNLFASSALLMVFKYPCFSCKLYRPWEVEGLMRDVHIFMALQHC